MAHSPVGPGGPPPHVDARVLRPGRSWYWVGGALIPLSLLTGLVLCAALLLDALAPPAFEARTRGTASVGFTVDTQRHPDRTWLLYASPAGAGEDECVVTSPTGEDITMGEAPYDYEMDSPRAGSWRLVGSFDLTEQGEHTLTCLAPESSTHVLAPGTGSGPWWFAEVAAGLALLFLTPLLGLAAGITVIVLTARGRDHHRQQILAGAPPPPPGHTPGRQGTGPGPGPQEPPPGTGTGPSPTGPPPR